MQTIYSHDCTSVMPARSNITCSVWRGDESCRHGSNRVTDWLSTLRCFCPADHVLVVGVQPLLQPPLLLRVAPHQLLLAGGAAGMELEDHVPQTDKVQQHDIHCVVCVQIYREYPSLSLCIYTCCDFLQLVSPCTIRYLSILHMKDYKCAVILTFVGREGSIAFVTNEGVGCQTVEHFALQGA